MSRRLFAGGKTRRRHLDGCIEHEKVEHDSEELIQMPSVQAELSHEMEAAADPAAQEVLSFGPSTASFERTVTCISAWELDDGAG
jgi:hypothetical protein